MREDSVLCLNPAGFHKMAYTVWGEEHKESVPVICVHGLMNTGRVFDFLAKELSQTRTVYCPDVVGRGKSDWLPDPLFYEQKQYLADITTLIARTGAPQVDWVGTSMGGITGMLLAALPNNPLRRLVLNDVGPMVPKESVEQIKAVFAEKKSFASLAAAEQALRQTYKGFGWLSDEQWALFAAQETRATPEGRLVLHYDQGIMAPIQVLESDVSMWPVYDAISCPTLVLRGGDSKLLSQELAEKMTKQGPCAALQIIEGVGHAPSLMAEDQIKTVTEFLNLRHDTVSPCLTEQHSPA